MLLWIICALLSAACALDSQYTNNETSIFPWRLNCDNQVALNIVKAVNVTVDENGIPRWAWNCYPEYLEVTRSKRSPAGGSSGTRTGTSGTRAGASSAFQKIKGNGRRVLQTIGNNPDLGKIYNENCY